MDILSHSLFGESQSRQASQPKISNLLSTVPVRLDSPKMNILNCTTRSNVAFWFHDKMQSQNTFVLFYSFLDNNYYENNQV